MSSVRLVIRSMPMASMEQLRKACEQYGKIYTDSYTSKNYVIVHSLVFTPSDVDVQHNPRGHPGLQQPAQYVSHNVTLS